MPGARAAGRLRQRGLPSARWVLRRRRLGIVPSPQLGCALGAGALDADPDPWLRAPASPPPIAGRRRGAQRRSSSPASRARAAPAGGARERCARLRAPRRASTAASRKLPLRIRRSWPAWPRRRRAGSASSTSASALVASQSSTSSQRRSGSAAATGQPHPEPRPPLGSPDLGREAARSTTSGTRRRRRRARGPGRRPRPRGTRGPWPRARSSPGRRRVPRPASAASPRARRARALLGEVEEPAQVAALVRLVLGAPAASACARSPSGASPPRQRQQREVVAEGGDRAVDQRLE